MARRSVQKLMGGDLGRAADWMARRFEVRGVADEIVPNCPLVEAVEATGPLNSPGAARSGSAGGVRGADGARPEA